MTVATHGRRTAFLGLMAATAAAASAIASTAAPAGVGPVPGEQTVVRIARMMGAERDVSCVDLGGPNAAGHTVLGQAVRRTGAIRLNSRYTCPAVIAWRRTGSFKPRTLQALVTIGHEIAHTRGVRNEARAECKGAQAALRLLPRLGVLNVHRLLARQWLRERHDSFAPAAYRLSRIGCRV